MQASLRNEKAVLSACSSPFIVTLHGTRNTEQCIHFIMEPLLGGELYSTYNRKGLHGSEQHARFYVACTALALEYLHGLHVVCRGVKPEDICLDSKGNAKLIDMGLAKFVDGKTYTTCGTPDYFAPELISGNGHAFGVDWWCLGVLLFELLTGHPPFESAYPMQVYSKVMKGIGQVSFPAACREAKPLILSLLKPQPEDRLPLQPDGLQRFKGHQWFKDFDWAALASQTMQPPYVPEVKSRTDMGNFSARKEDMPTTIPYQDDGTGWDSDF